MPRFSAAALKGTSYFLGTLTGMAIAIPLTATAFSPAPTGRGAPIAPIAAPAGALFQSSAIDRTAKGARLDLRVTPSAGAHNTSVATKSSTPEPVTPSRTMQATRGCASSVGVTRANLTTEELTVCVASASMIQSIN
ncbi:hypothetical protein MKI84_07515 [Ancylobacter sp. A5.8]|uniref:hypothetical protein n=1 Tax=Ancylobacter gelatini TaxID=2919920 RepID=UPI001F4E865B|nr:hypothetical protein [Ancylobacter gelatini]MCJ8142763.1 hypothetical protein [Ancylobacter gelatini]